MLTRVSEEGSSLVGTVGIHQYQTATNNTGNTGDHSIPYNGRVVNIKCKRQLLAVRRTEDGRVIQDRLAEVCTG